MCRHSYDAASAEKFPAHRSLIVGKPPTDYTQWQPHLLAGLKHSHTALTGNPAAYAWGVKVSLRALLKGSQMQLLASTAFSQYTQSRIICLLEALHLSHLGSKGFPQSVLGALPDGIAAHSLLWPGGQIHLQLGEAKGPHHVLYQVQGGANFICYLVGQAEDVPIILQGTMGVL